MTSHIRLLVVGLGILGGLAAFATDAPKKIPFSERAFFGPLTQGMKTAPAIWPQLNFKPSDIEVQRMQNWLLNHQYELGSWPPRFGSEAGGQAAIAEWENFQNKYAADDERFLKSIDGVVIYATFFLYGHHMDEPGASTQGLAFLNKATKRYPKSAYPVLLGGLMNVTFGGKDMPVAGQLLHRALEINESPTINGYALAGLASYHIFGCQPHHAVLDYAKSLETCPSCLNSAQKEGIAPILGARFASSADKKASPLVTAHDKRVESPLLGFSFTPPPGWIDSEGAGGEYDPAQAVQTTDIPAAKLPNGLIHSLTIFAWVKDSGAGPTIESFIQKFKSNKEMVAMKEIAPPFTSPNIAHWYTFESRRPVGSGDTISGIVVRTKKFIPTPWTSADHEHALESEAVACDNSPGQGGWTDKRDVSGLYRQRSETGRLNAPVEMLLIYSASKGSMDYAQRSLNTILKSMKIETRSGSRLLTNSPQ